MALLKSSLKSWDTIIILIIYTAHNLNDMLKFTIGNEEAWTIA